MTTMTLTRRNNPPFKLLFLMAIIVAVALVVPQVKERTHADLHAEADMIRRCYQNENNWQARLTFFDLPAGLQRDHILCQLPDGRVGDRVTQWCKRSGWLEITAFVIGDGQLATAIRTLRSMGCELVWKR